MADEKNFFAGLFDFSFQQQLTRRIVKLLYILGILFGGVPTIWHYLNPRNGAVVLSWYGTVVALWVASIYWFFFRRGAEMLIAHPGLFNLPGDRPWVLKGYFLLCLAGGMAGLLMMIIWDVPPPR